MIESQIAAFIQDVGLSQDDFIKACAYANKPVHQRLLNQLIAADDFLLFKGMMVRRNL